MEIKTVFGVTWRIPTNFEILLIVLFLLLIVSFLVLLKLHLNKKEKKLNDYQLFLFKLKRSGLSNFQIRIINNMTKILKLSDPNLLLQSPGLFEKSIGTFLQFLRQKNENADSLTAICKDITITYDKIYKPSAFKKKLETVTDIEVGQLLYFVSPDADVFLGKLVSADEDKLVVQLFRLKKQLRHLQENQDIVLHVWRLGDAEYIFNSSILNIEEQLVQLAIPQEFERTNEFRLPFLDVVLAAVVQDLDENKTEATIVKINDFELVVRSRVELNYQKNYEIQFDLTGFNIVIKAQLIADSTIQENHVFYYTFKYIKMSDAAKSILKKYMYEHL